VLDGHVFERDTTHDLQGRGGSRRRQRAER
jgi:hypothetical protein